MVCCTVLEPLFVHNFFFLVPAVNKITDERRGATDRGYVWTLMKHIKRCDTEAKQQRLEIRRCYRDSHSQRHRHKAKDTEPKPEPEPE